MSTTAKKNWPLLTAFLSLLLLSLFAREARAAIIWWNPGGTGYVGSTNVVWDTTTKLWSPVALQTNTSTLIAWVNADAAGFCAGPTASTQQGIFSVTVNNTISFAGFFNGSQNPGPCDVTFNGSGALSLNSGQQAFSTYNSSLGASRFNIPVTGPGNVTLESSGQTYFNVSNTYTGGTTLGFSSGSWSGLLNYANGGAFGSGAVVMTSGFCSGALVNSTTNAVTFANSFTTANGSVNIIPGANGTTFTGPWTLAGAATISSGITNNLVTISGVMSGSGSFTKGGAGNTKLGGANTFTGGLGVTGGYLTIGSTNGIGKGIVTVTSPGTLDMSNFSLNLNGFNGTGNVTNSGASTVTASIGGDGTSTTFTGVIKGPINVTKLGAGLFTMGGASTYSGVTTISAGAVKFSSSTAFPDGSVVVNAGAGLDISASTARMGSLSGSGTLTNNNTTLDGAGSTNGFNAYSSFNGSIAGNAGTVIFKTGAGAMSIHQTNFSDPAKFIFLKGGTLSLGSGDNLLPTNKNYGALSNSTFELEGNKQTFTGFTNSGNINLGGGTLTIAGGSSTFNGSVRDSDLPGSSTALGHGLRGSYYDNPDFTSLVAVRDDANVNFANLTTAGVLPAAITDTNYISIRWVGQILTTAAGTYTFTTAADDGERLWVNGTLVTENWLSGNNTKTGTVTLGANTRYNIVLEYMNITGGASAKLSWTPPGDSVATVIPTDYLFLPGAGSLVVSNGLFTMNGTNTYTGSTIVANGGTLETSNTLSGGSVTVNDNGTLTLDTPALSANGDLILSPGVPIVNINFTGTNVIHGLSTDGGATYLAAGLYGSPDSGAPNQILNFLGETQGYLQVTAGGSSNVLTASTPSSTYGDSVTFTSTVTGPGATPTGSVTFYDGANAIGTVALASGVATLTVSDLQVTGSPHAIKAVYNGDVNYVGSTSGTVSETVAPYVISVSSLVVSDKVYDGTSNATFTVTASEAINGDTNNVHATGNAFFSDKNVGTGKTVTATGLTLVGSLGGNYVLSGATGTFSANITPKSAGVSGITAAARVYNGTTNADINLSAATITNAIAGDSVTVNPTSGVGSFATATVGVNKQVTIRGLTTLGVDANNYTLINALATNNITVASTTTGVSSSANPAASGSTVTFTATENPVAPGGGVPTGNVTFLTNGVTLGTSALSGAIAVSSGAVLPDGTNTVTVKYTGDANFIGSTNTYQQILGGVVLIPSTNIVITAQGTNIVLTWNGTGTLQTTTNIATNWVDVPSATSPYTNSITTNRGTFFRMRN